MGGPTLVMNADHLLVEFHGLDRLAGLARRLMIPYSTIERAEVAAPEWPGAWDSFGIGLRAPPFILKGRVGRLLGPYDRFFWQDRGTKRVLRLHLRGHPKLREVHLDVEDPEGALASIERMRKR